MNLPAPPIFRPEDFPDEDPQLLALLTRGFQQLNDGVQSVPETGSVEGVAFVSAPSGNTTVEFSFTTSARPSHVTVTDISRDDGVALSAAYSSQFVLKESTVAVTFVGLPASQKMHFSAEYS